MCNLTKRHRLEFDIHDAPPNLIRIAARISDIGRYRQVLGGIVCVADAHCLSYIIHRRIRRRGKSYRQNTWE